MGRGRLQATRDRRPAGALHSIGFMGFACLFVGGVTGCGTIDEGSAVREAACIGVLPSPCGSGSACTTANLCEPVRGTAALLGFEIANSAIAYRAEGSFAVTVGHDLPCHPYWPSPPDTLTLRLREGIRAGVTHTLDTREVMAVQWNALGSGGGQEWAASASLRLDIVGTAPGETIAGTLHVETGGRAIEGTFAARVCE